MRAIDEINLLVKSASGVVFSSDADANRIDSEARRTGQPAMRAPTRGEWFRRVYGDRPRATISAKQEPTRSAIARGGNANPDEMLGNRMNPILIAPAMAVAGAESVPATAFAAIKDGLGSTVGDDAKKYALKFIRDGLKSRGGLTASLSNLVSM